MTGPETPKFAGPHRRCGLPLGSLSMFHSVLVIAVGVIVAVFFATMLWMR